MSRRVFSSLLVIGLGFALMMAPATANAEEEATPNPVTKIVAKIQQTVQPKSNDDVSTQSHVDAPDPPFSDSDSTGNETQNPTGPDHASTRGIFTNLLGEEVVTTNDDNATIHDDDRATADSTALAVGGNEIIGAHADSDGTTQDDFDILFPLCDGTGGAICISVLYAHAQASDDGDTSQAQSQSGLVDVCLGGTDTDPFAACEGPLALGASNSGAFIERDQSSGQTQAFAFYEAVSLNDFVLLDSFGFADSGGAFPFAARGSQVLGNSTPAVISIPPGCPVISLACLFLNQGETYLGDETAGTAQDALLLRVIQGTPLAPTVLFAGVGHTETLVHKGGGDDDDDTPPPDEDDDDTPRDEDDDDNGDDDDDGKSGGDRALPDTGSPSSLWLAVGLLGVAAGSGFMAYGRRERGTPR